LENLVSGVSVGVNLGNMAKPKVQGQLKSNSGTTVANMGTNLMAQGPKGAKAKPMLPGYSIVSRSPPFLRMMMNPVEAEAALPPCSLPARATCWKQYQEVLLTTNASGNAGLKVQPLMAAQYATVATWSSNSWATMSSDIANTENPGFQTNFFHMIPLCVEVVMKFTGNSTQVAGRMYGIVGAASNPDFSSYPNESNGCEAITSEGISCTWYSTSPVWANPASASATTCPAEWMDCTIWAGMLGGPASLTNCVTVGIYFHLAAFPKTGTVGITSMASLPDPSLEYAAALLHANEEGLGASATSLKNRDKQRKRKALLKDVVRYGGKAVGTIFPQAGAAVSIAQALADMLD